MRIDKEITDELEEYLDRMLENSVNSRDLEVRDYAVGVSLKVSQLLLNLKSLQGADTQEELMEKMKEIDFSKLDINSMLQGMMKGEV